ncbi:MAG: FixH family protein [Cyclobacteriaceae bacterium]
MNFGKWIFVSFVLFTAFIATLVTVCVRQDINLVSADYYQEELVHEQKMNQIQNANNLKSKPLISVEGSVVSVSFDDFNKIEKGELKILRPSDARLDRRFKLSASQTQVRQFTLENSSKGLYRASMQWRMDGKDFYYEKLIVL